VVCSFSLGTRPKGGLPVAVGVAPFVFFKFPP